jgi:hypothetical protein
VSAPYCAAQSAVSSVMRVSRTSQYSRRSHCSASVVASGARASNSRTSSAPGKSSTGCLASSAHRALVPHGSAVAALVKVGSDSRGSGEDGGEGGVPLPHAKPATAAHNRCLLRPGAQTCFLQPSPSGVLKHPHDDERNPTSPTCFLPRMERFHWRWADPSPSPRACSFTKMSPRVGVVTRFFVDLAQNSN